MDVRIDFDGAGPGQPVQVFSLLVDTDHRELGGMLRYNQRVAAHDLSFGVNYGQTDVEGGDYSHEGGVPTGLVTIVDNDATGLELYLLDRWQVSDRALLELGAQGVLAKRNVVNIDRRNQRRAQSERRFFASSTRGSACLPRERRCGFVRQS